MGNEPLHVLYHGYADKERAFAADSRLPSVKSLHERAARKWDELADQAEKASNGRRD